MLPTNDDFELLAEEEDSDPDDEDEQDDLSNDDKHEETVSEGAEYVGFTFIHNNILSSIQDRTAIPKSWILLDSQSTEDVLSNPRLLNSIQDAKKTLTLH